MTPQRPEVHFPSGVLDAAGRPLRPGAAVDVGGSRGEVVGWVDDATIEVLTGDDVPVLVRAAPSSVRKVPAPVAGAVEGWVVVDDAAPPTVLVVPVGGRDVQPRASGLGPFPDPRDPAGSPVVGAREWGEACLAVLDGRPRPAAAGAVAEHLDAPILRRVLTEAVLGESVDRLVLLCSDQRPARDDDTEPFARLLTLWLEGSTLPRAVGHVESLLLHEAPHLVEAVFHDLKAALPHLTAGAGRVVIVQAGGTPAMASGALLALVTAELDVEVRHLQVPRGGPLVELDLPRLVPVPRGR